MLRVAVCRSSLAELQYMLCISAFVDDVMFSYNGPYSRLMLPQQFCCSIVYGLTPLLHGTVVVASCSCLRRWWVPRPDKSFVKKVAGWGQSMQCTIALFLVWYHVVIISSNSILYSQLSGRSEGIVMMYCQFCNQYDILWMLR